MSSSRGCARAVRARATQSHWEVRDMNASSSAIRTVRWIVLAAVLVGLATFLWFATRPAPLTVQGEVSANRVDVSPRVNGRVAKLGGDVGDTIKRGALLADLQSPQLSASLLAARAALAVA